MLLLLLKLLLLMWLHAEQFGDESLILRDALDDQRLIFMCVVYYVVVIHSLVLKELVFVIVNAQVVMRHLAFLWAQEVIAGGFELLFEKLQCGTPEDFQVHRVFVDEAVRHVKRLRVVAYQVQVES